jgi:hypothetical protein
VAGPAFRVGLSTPSRPAPGALPAGADRTARLGELRRLADGRTDLLVQAAGSLLGVRIDDEHDHRHRGFTAGAEMLHELAGVTEDDPEVRHWVAIGREWRERSRIRPEPDWGWSG